MIAVNVRRQGGAAIMTIPSDILDMLNIHVGTKLALNIVKGSLVAHPINQSKQKRYTLKELLEGTSSEEMKNLNAETAWANEGNPVGREIV